MRSKGDSELDSDKKIWYMKTEVGTKRNWKQKWIQKKNWPEEGNEKVRNFVRIISMWD